MAGVVHQQAVSRAKAVEQGVQAPFHARAGRLVVGEHEEVLTRHPQHALSDGGELPGRPAGEGHIRDIGVILDTHGQHMQTRVGRRLGPLRQPLGQVILKTGRAGRLQSGQFVFQPLQLGFAGSTPGFVTANAVDLGLAGGDDGVVLDGDVNFLRQDGLGKVNSGRGHLDRFDRHLDLLRLASRIHRQGRQLIVADLQVDALPGQAVIRIDAKNNLGFGLFQFRFEASCAIGWDVAQDERFF